MPDPRKIKNFDQLAVTEGRRAALEIAEAGLWAIDTKAAIRGAVAPDKKGINILGESFPISANGRLIVIGVGKCSLDAAAALEDILGERIDEGAIVDVRTGAPLKRIRAMTGTHPLPSARNVQAATTIVEMLQGLGEEDLVLFVISGGGSTLLCLPQDAGCEDEALIFEELTHAGATIQEINIVRKHLSTARGGYLAKYAYPARVVSLLFSDVPGNDPQFIASGPTVKSTSSIADAEAVLAKYDTLRACRMDHCGLVETPKEDKYFEKVRNVVLVSDKTALEAMRRKAEELGLKAGIMDDRLTGEAGEVATSIARALHEAPPGACRLYGGETTVTMADDDIARGGRNLEMAASALQEVREDEVLLAFPSDGRDNGLFAGALCDIITKKAAEDAGVDVAAALKKHDTYPLFERIGNHIETGPTGSNVSDLVIALKFSPDKNS